MTASTRRRSCLHHLEWSDLEARAWWTKPPRSEHLAPVGRSRTYSLRGAQASPRGRRCQPMRRTVRENAPCALVAAAGCAVMAWLGLYSFAWNDYETEARPAFEALAHGHVLGFLRLPPPP